MRIDLQYEQSPIKIDYSVRGLVRMNLNENLVMPREFVASILTRCAKELDSRFYPSDLDEGEMLELKQEISKYAGCRESLVFLGAGSDQLIDLLCRIRLKKPTDELVTIKPTFSMYYLRAVTNGSSFSDVPLGYQDNAEDPFTLESALVEKSCRSKDAKIFVIACPNNPTAIQYPIAQVKEMMDSIPESVTVMLDEAYVEYARYNAVPLLRKYQNLMILRTFSKAFGLASHRIGYMLTENEEFAKSFNGGVQYPFPLPAMSVLLARELLREKETVIGYAKEAKKLREDLIEELVEMKRDDFIPVERSDANFVLVQSPDSENIARQLLSKYKIAVKYIPSMVAGRSFIRITVGTEKLNANLIRALKQIRGSRSK